MPCSDHPVAVARRAARAVRAVTRGKPGQTHNLYVVLLTGLGPDGRGTGFYVGETAHDPAHRFRQHLAGIRASRIVRHHGTRLLPRLTAHLNPLSRAEAKKLEPVLAARLRTAGLVVKGGH
jgi:hypothetical protein